MDMVAAKRTTKDYPFADIFNPSHVATFKEAAKNLREEIGGGGYTRKKYETMDKTRLAKIEKWLALIK